MGVIKVAWHALMLPFILLKNGPFISLLTNFALNLNVLCFHFEDNGVTES